MNCWSKPKVIDLPPGGPGTRAGKGPKHKMTMAVPTRVRRAEGFNSFSSLAIRKRTMANEPAKTISWLYGNLAQSHHQRKQNKNQASAQNPPVGMNRRSAAMPVPD